MSPQAAAVTGGHKTDDIEDERTPIITDSEDLQFEPQPDESIEMTTTTNSKWWWLLFVGSLVGAFVTLLSLTLGPSSRTTIEVSPNSPSGTATNKIDYNDDDDDDGTRSFFVSAANDNDDDDDEYAQQKNEDDDDSTVPNQLLQKCFAPRNNKDNNSKRPFSATVLLMRHCEKYGQTTDPQGNEHCNVIGRERAQYIAEELFPQRWPPPSYLYATSQIRSDHYNYREVETIKPLAEKYKLPIQDTYDADHVEELTADICHRIMDAHNEQQNNNQDESDRKKLLLVVNWKHSEMPNVAQHLGCGAQEGCPMKYPSDSFDEVWELKFLFDPTQETPWSVYGYVTQQYFDPLQWENRPSPSP